MDENTLALFRPVGQKEMDLIKETGCRELPPRLVGAIDEIDEFRP